MTLEYRSGPCWVPSSRLSDGNYVRAENQTGVPRRIALGPATSRMMWDTLLKRGFNRLMQYLWPETRRTVLQTIPRDEWYSVRTPSIFFGVDSSCNAHEIAAMNTHCAQSLSSSFRRTRPKSSEVCHSFIILPAIYLIVCKCKQRGRSSQSLCSQLRNASLMLMESALWSYNR